jgi:hypothetical protein
VRVEGLGKLKESIDIIGKGTRTFRLASTNKAAAGIRVAIRICTVVLLQFVFLALFSFCFSTAVDYCSDGGRVLG